MGVRRAALIRGRTRGGAAFAPAARGEEPVPSPPAPAETARIRRRLPPLSRRTAARRAAPCRPAVEDSLYETPSRPVRRLRTLLAAIDVDDPRA
ncbi:hypothetical protein C7S16_2780 [Burkholderia thailandensis]|uniref:Uncharacterized protein n=1 Tax=Burkholderia thailandensis TaxID=57975 RepID=A0AAW9D3Z6_BURTH|nr:hypothetical protein [Burkholderia thailandensis]MDW9256727.1 hypothetical protein [Burkholderia thailandensis]